MGWFLCNGNPGLKSQYGSMVNANLQTLLIVSSLKKNLKLQLGRCVHTASNSNNANLLLDTEENIKSIGIDMTFYTLINHFRKLTELLQVQHSDVYKLKQLQAGVPRKWVNFKIENVIEDD